MQGSQGDLTWKTDLDSTGDPTLTNAPGRLMELAEGASNDINMLENSFVALKTPGEQTRAVICALGVVHCAILVNWMLVKNRYPFLYDLVPPKGGALSTWVLRQAEEPWTNAGFGPCRRVIDGLEAL